MLCQGECHPFQILFIPGIPCHLPQIIEVIGPRLSIGTTVVAWESPLKENRLGGSSHLLSN